MQTYNYCNCALDGWGSSPLPKAKCRLKEDKPLTTSYQGNMNRGLEKTKG